MRTLEEAVSELERELGVRLRCYDRWIKEGKLSSVDARDRLERLSAAVHYLKATMTTPPNEDENVIKM